MNTNTQTFTGWVSKYALSAGLQKKELKETVDNGYTYEPPHSIFGFRGRLGRDCHRTKEEAVARAEKMRKDKIASLKKQITKLEQLKFD
jgi:hypothetical protein